MSALSRWRLILGRFAENGLGGSGRLDDAQARMDRALDYLYGREYAGRGVRRESGPGTLDPSQIRLVDWLHEVRELFPRETVEIVEKHALDRYGLTELVTDNEVLQKLEPNHALLRTLLSLRGHLRGDVLQTARRIVRQVVEELKKRLESDVRRAFSGRLQRFRHSPMPVWQNFDVRGTIRRNLKNFDLERKKLLVEELRFFERNQRRMPWEIILCVDQSGSMVDSVIHSAVMAGILCGLPSLRVRIVVFDTEVVDLSDHVDDPVEVLMSVQLGGGTDIGKAVRYGGSLIANPHRTIFVLISDFCEGASPAELVRAVKQLAEARVTLLGLASLDDGAAPHYDRHMAERLAALGMEIAALTPQKLAQWIVGVIS